jgi:hypothetical protein
MSSLPTEVLDMIFTFLGPVESCCLDLTKKSFYHIHRVLHGTVNLKQPSARNPFMLYDHLKAWMATAKPMLVWNSNTMAPKYVTERKLQETIDRYKMKLIKQ